MKAASLPYPGHGDLSSGKLENSGFRIAYHDVSPELVHYINTITISKGHRMVSGFFGTGLLIAGITDQILGWTPTDSPTITTGFGFITSLILIFICISRNATINQLMGLLHRKVRDEGFPVLTKNTALHEALANLSVEEYVLSIPSPFLMLKGIEIIPRA